jgi:Uma2 family endonuclease
MNFALAEIPLPLRFRPQTPMSDEELMRFCAANEIVDLERNVDGEICLRPLPGAWTSMITAGMIAQLAEWNRKHERGVCFAHSGFTLQDGSMLSPALAWVEHSIWDALSDEDQERYAPICPQFLMEIVSPVRGLAELQAKMHSG